MVFEKLPLKGLMLITPKIFYDDRGYFFECYNSNDFKDNGINVNFLQDNQSLSNKGVLRGLHFQNPPFEQGKLVRVIAGSVRDVVVDIRRKSSTFGQHFITELSGKTNNMLWIPPGFAHGFITLEDNTVFTYKCTNIYIKESESGIIYNDPALGINWGKENPHVSKKDLQLKKMLDVNILF